MRTDQLMGVVTRLKKEIDYLHTCIREIEEVLAEVVDEIHDMNILEEREQIDLEDLLEEDETL